jgi:hypothetical protein
LGLHGESPIIFVFDDAGEKPSVFRFQDSHTVIEGNNRARVEQVFQDVIEVGALGAGQLRADRAAFSQVPPAQ